MEAGVKNREPDRRVRRTRQILQDALTGLILEKPYHAITIQDVLDRADVGRSTFYTHYHNKDDLLMGSFNRLLESMGRHLEARTDSESGIAFFPTRELFQHVRDNHHLFKALVSGEGVDLLFKHGKSALSQQIEHHLERQIPDPETISVPLPVLSNFLAGSLISLLQWWLENRMPYSPERLAVMYEQLVTPGVRAVLSPSIP